MKSILTTAQALVISEAPEGRPELARTIWRSLSARTIQQGIMDMLTSLPFSDYDEMFLTAEKDDDKWIITENGQRLEITATVETVYIPDYIEDDDQDEDERPGLDLDMLTA